MSITHGTFVWYELMARDVVAAERFYGQVIGWTGADAGIPGMDYRMLLANGRPVAGVMAAPEGASVEWVAYLDVDDVDRVAAAVEAGGGVLHQRPWDVPGMMRLAVGADPEGATIAFHKRLTEGSPEAPPESASGPSSTPLPGHGSWRELHANDSAAAFAFYAPLFDWQSLHEMDMGSLGIYRIFGRGETQFGGMFSDPAAAGGSFWLYYFQIEDVGAAAQRVRDAGGTITTEPQQVPGGGWVVHCRDPEGSRFALVGPMAAGG